MSSHPALKRQAIGKPLGTCLSLPAPDPSSGFALLKMTSVEVFRSLVEGPTSRKRREKWAPGFLLSNGSFTTVDVPGARSTIIFGINNAGMLVGQYTMNGKVHGFVAVPGEN